ncbi:unnamed protein product [Meloidogyne enterolobii]|uniref:Uncharacterized protein n=1 Tax=Meloidogyne enterolobii TaxID=390850 RepID=A0ACB0Y896_MELEN
MSPPKDFSAKCIPPRDYQVELLDRAKIQNTIISLGTGSGKTFVAVLLIKEYSQRLLHQNEKAVFLVNTVELVAQQAEHIEFHSSLSVARISGSTIKRKYERKEVEKITSSSQVIVITAQVFLDLINHGLFDFSSLALLIVDECHHCLGELHPYRLIMNHYKKLQGQRPRVLGLTASILNKKVPSSRIECTAQLLEQIMDSQIETSSNYTQICKYVTKPKQFIVCTKDDCTNEKFVVDLLERLRSFIEKNEDFHSELEVDPRRKIYETISRSFSTLQQVGSWAALKGFILWQKNLLKHVDDPIIGNKQKCILRMAETAFRTCSKVLSHKINPLNSYDKLGNVNKSYISDRVRKLLEILKSYSPSKRELSGIKDTLFGLVFVKERFIAFMINNLLRFLVKQNPEEFGHLKVDFIVGHTGNSETGDEDRRLVNRKQERTLTQFRNGQLNLLITTNVLEEGIDLRNCNLVIRFDPPMDFRSFIQSSGRARRENSAFYILIEEKNYLDFMMDLTGYAQAEEFVLRRYRSGNDFTLEGNDETKMIHPHLDDAVAPYVVTTEKGTAKVSLSNAIQLVNRYCAKLPSDIFTRLVPRYTIQTLSENGQTLYIAELYLPINSPIKEPIKSKPMTSKRLALMAVALEACKRLHQRKELNDNLLPAGKDILDDLLGEVDDDEYLPHLPSRMGSSKKKRLYDRKMSKTLNSTLPSQNSECILYVMEMKLVKPVTDEGNPKRRKIIDPFESNSAFGFLSSKELPKVPGFPVFQRNGEMLVQIRKVKNQQFRPTFELLQLIYLFHQHIFEDILRVARGGVVFAPVSTADLDYEIDKDYLNWNIRESPTTPSDEIRKQFSFEESNYLNSVVSPWYRSEDQSAFYYVAEIMTDQFPSSSFPDEKFTCFNQYFMSKYQLEIYNQKQNLLDVDHTSARMNLLLPRAITGKSATRSLDPSQRQILVPELVHIHPLSATLWSIIVTLPTILYRLNSLLLADEFRSKVLEDALKFNSQTPDDFEWSPLQYVTLNDDLTQKSIKNLDQLRKMNKQEKENEVPMELDIIGENVNETAASGINDFEIGVWDPSDGAQMSNNDNTSNEPSPVIHNAPVNGLIPGRRNGLRGVIAARDEELSEIIAVGNDTTLHNYGDISDDDDVAAEYDKFKFLMDNKMTTSDIGDLGEMDVRPAGWNDDSNANTISTNNPHINIASLMNDLEKNYAAFGTSSHISNNNKANTPIIPSATAVDKTVLQRKELNLDSLNNIDPNDQSVKRQNEDILPEEVFWGMDEAQIGENISSEETNKIIQTKSADSISPTRDLRDLEKQNFKIMAPELKWMPFSFMWNLLDQNPHGVSPALLLQALTTSSAADGINLERLETIGDSFLKMAVTNYFYYKHTEQHEGKLSYARSKEVSNSHLFYLGRQRGIPLLIETLKFDPHVNWLPPCYASTSEFHAVNPFDYTDLDEDQREVPMEGVDTNETVDQQQKINKEAITTGWGTLDDDKQNYKRENGVETLTFPQPTKSEIPDLPPMPYNMLTQQWISDKSIADAVEALIGAHLIQLGQSATLKFMNWLGIKVLTDISSLPSPLLRFIDTPEDPNLSLKHLALLYEKFDFATVENNIGYKFANKAYLVQAFTHASYYNNRVTGCYQRLEFLGDAVLDYMITRFLYEHKKQYSPGVLTDLRSALVNNTIFASLAVKYSFHKHFVMICPPLYQMVEKFVNFCKQKDFLHCANFDDEIFMLTEDEIDEEDLLSEEDVEVPKAMGDIFESIAGAVYLDCGMDLDIVWRVFYNLMRDVIQKCCENPPQSPVRELFERKNCRAKFSKLERKLETGKVRVTVTVNDNLQFTGMGRSYRIAKCTAAKRALQHLRKLDATKSAKNK